MTAGRSPSALRGLLLCVPVLAASLVISGETAGAAPTPVGLGTATNFAIRADDAVTNVPTSAITGDLGLSPAAGAFYTDATICTQMTAGSTIYSVSDGLLVPCDVVDAGHMTTVSNDALAAFNNVSGLAGATTTPTDLATLAPLVAGLYTFGHDPTSNINGTLTLDAQGDPNAVWIFQASSDLVTATGSTVQFVNAPAGSNLACNVFWTVQSSATINSGSTFIGTILAAASITVGSGATVTGRLLAGNAAGTGGGVTLIQDTIIRPTGCTVLPAGSGGGPAAPPAAGGPTGGPPTAAAPPATPVLSPPVLTG